MRWSADRTPTLWDAPLPTEACASGPKGGCVRFVATVFLWLVTTVALAVAIPARWAQKNIVDANGYAAFAQSAAKDPKLQQAMASELTTQIVSLASGKGYHLNSDLVRTVTTAYTQNAGFPGQFAQANRIAPTWLFTDEIRRQEGTDDRWLIDIAPMLSDPSLRQALGTLNLDVPDTLTVPITVSDSAGMAPRQVAALSRGGAMGQRRGRDPCRRFGATHPGRRAVARQSSCGAGCFGATGGRCGLGRAGGDASLSQYRTGSHDG